MSEVSVSNAPNVKASRITKNIYVNNTKTPYPILTINAENYQVLQITDNKQTAVNQTVQILNIPKQNEEFVNETPRNNIIYRILRPEDLDLKVPENILKPVKRPKHKIFIKEEIEEEQTIPNKIFRTRSGRMSKPPKYIQQEELPQFIVNANETSIPVPQEKKELINLNSFQINSNQNNVQEEIPETVSEENKEASQLVSKIVQKRKVKSQYRCGTCKKAYFGQNKMLKHLQLNPNHVAPDFNTNSTELNLWPELLRKTMDLPKKQQNEIFCRELFHLIKQAQSIIPKLLKASDKDEDTNLSVDAIVSNALGIPEGNYSYDGTVSLNDIIHNKNEESTTNITDTVKANNIENEIMHNNDQNSLLNLLDTGQVTFDSSTNSEEVMNVDQLVNERLKTLTGGDVEPSNNTTPNLSLDLSLDMFSYTT